MQELTLPDTQIVAATAIAPQPTWQVENDALSGSTVAVAQPFCRVQGRIEGAIEFEVWLPTAAAWNGKRLGVGNGGFAGFINYSALAHGLRRGYASSATDTGHKGGPMNAQWALNAPQRIEDYAHRAQHLTAVAAQSIVSAYYDKVPRYSYFMGCSNGGQQGLIEAQRYPDDYDGIISGAPGTNFPDMSTSVMLSGLRNAASIPGALTAQDMQLAVQRMVQACDADDGLEDGLIEHPPSCRFEFATLACSDRGEAQCLDTTKVDNLKALFEPLRDAQGRPLVPGLALGTMLPASELERRGKMGADVYRFMVFHDPHWDPRSFSLERDLPVARERLSSLISEKADLSHFAGRGGRLILYHGWSDSGPSPFVSIDYYDAARRTMGVENSNEFMRLFMAPGMEHCRGGTGPNSFGNAGDPPVLDAQHDILMALEQWVERDIAPQRLIASFTRDGHVERTRPLCPYPQRARYMGRGNPDRAENFECAAP